jgi:hypothetical protein
MQATLRSTKVNNTEAIFNYIADNARPSLNPTEVHEAFPHLAYDSVSKTMNKLAHRGFLKNDYAQYSLAIPKNEAVFGNRGRPVKEVTVTVAGESLIMSTTTAKLVLRQLKKQVK